MTKPAAKKPRPDTINRLSAGVYPAMAMLAGMQLDLFTPLGDGAKTAKELATALGLPAARLQPLLYALVTAELLTVDGERFSNTVETDHFLVRDRTSYIGGQHEAFSDLWAATLQTAQSIRTGAPQAKHDFNAMSADELRAFVRGLDAGAGAAARRLLRSYDFTRFRRLLDAGGGSGGLAMALCRALPDLHGTIADLPNVAAISREFVSEAQMDERIDVIDADLVTAPPAGRYDAAVLRALLQVLGPEAASAVVANVGRTVEPGGEIFIIGRVLDDSRLSPLDTVASNVMFLNIYDEGQAYTEGEHREWLAAAGFTDVERQELAGGYSIMRGMKT